MRTILMLALAGLWLTGCLDVNDAQVGLDNEETNVYQKNTYYADTIKSVDTVYQVIEKTVYHADTIKELDTVYKITEIGTVVVTDTTPVNQGNSFRYKDMLFEYMGSRLFLTNMSSTASLRNINIAYSGPSCHGTLTFTPTIEPKMSDYKSPYSSFGGCSNNISTPLCVTLDVIRTSDTIIWDGHYTMCKQ